MRRGKRPFPMFKPEEKMKQTFYEEDQTKSEEIYMYSTLPEHIIPSPLKELITSSHNLQPLHSVF